MKIARFKSLEYGFDTFDGDKFEKVEGYIRTSEYAEVEFLSLPASEVVPKQIEALKAQQTKVREEHAIVMAGFDEKIGKLLALTHEN